MIISLAIQTFGSCRLKFHDNGKVSIFFSFCLFWPCDFLTAVWVCSLTVFTTFWDQPITTLWPRQPRQLGASTAVLKGGNWAPLGPVVSGPAPPPASSIHDALYYGPIVTSPSLIALLSIVQSDFSVRLLQHLLSGSICRFTRREHHSIPSLILAHITAPFSCHTLKFSVCAFPSSKENKQTKTQTKHKTQLPNNRLQTSSWNPALSTFDWLCFSKQWDT